MCCGDERTASLKLYSDGWRCYRCNEGGDIFDLLRHLEKVDSKQAFSICADLAGVEIRGVTIIRPQYPNVLKALEEAKVTGSTELPYRRSDFPHSYLWEIYKAYCLGIRDQNIEEMRQELMTYSRAWPKRMNGLVSETINELDYGGRGGNYDKIYDFIDKYLTTDRS
jgi:hypothetical protein